MVDFSLADLRRPAHGTMHRKPPSGDLVLNVSNLATNSLIDFGATEAVTPERVEQLRELGCALRDDDVQRLAAASAAAGFTAAEDRPEQTRRVIGMMRMAGEPLRHDGAYDFGASDLFARSLAQGRAQFFGEGYARTSPPDLQLLQRKFAGTFMLCTRLRARVDLAAVFAGEL